MRVEIIAIGRELLRGRVADRNSPFVAELLSRRGALIHRITVVDDTERATGMAVLEALKREAALVVTTGGLGPAADDRTLLAVSEALQRPLSAHQHAREMVESAYRRLRERGLVASEGMTSAREKMCSVPVGGEPIPNPVGTAPGVLIRLPGGSSVLCLPGVPEEARAVLDEALPLLRDLLPRSFVAQREVETPATDESALRPVLDRLAEEFPSVWIKSHAPGFAVENARIRVTLEAAAPKREEAETIVENALRRLMAMGGGGP